MARACTRPQVEDEWEGQVQSHREAIRDEKLRKEEFEQAWLAEQERKAEADRARAREAAREARTDAVT